MVPRDAHPRHARSPPREVARLERELAVLKDSHSIPPKDEVLAILDRGSRDVRSASRSAVCGRSGDVAAAVASAGAAYAGLNFFPKSPRYVTPEARVRWRWPHPRGCARWR
jgi:hypothetical protein